MNIAVMGVLISKGPSSKKEADSVNVSHGRGCKRGNKLQDFLQVLEQSKQGIKSATIRNTEITAGKNQSHTVGKSRTGEPSQGSRNSCETCEPTEFERTNGQQSEELNSQLAELINLLSAMGITPGEVNNSPGDNSPGDNSGQNFSGQFGGQPEVLATTQQKAHVIQLLQLVRKLAGEMNSSGDANFEAVLQKLNDAQLTDGSTSIDAGLVKEVLEGLKNNLNSFKQETVGNTANTVNYVNRHGMTVVNSSEKKPGEDAMNGLVESVVSVTETGKQALSSGSVDTREQIVTEGTVKTELSDSDKGNSSQHSSGSGLPKGDFQGFNTNVDNLNEMKAESFEPETYVNGSSVSDVHKMSDLEHLSEAAKVTRSIFGQIAQKAKLIVAPGVTEMQIQLKPEVLGKLNLTISSENGLVTAKFNAESHAVKAIIEANLGSLKDALAQQGVKVDQLVVDIGSQTHQHGFGGRNGYYNGNASEKNGVVSVNAEEVDKLFSRDAHSGAVNAYYGSTVEFTA